MKLITPIRSDLEQLARALEQARPGCQMVRTEMLAGKLVQELADSGQAAYPDALEQALYRADRRPEARWQAVIEGGYITKLRPDWTATDREMTGGDRFVHSSAIRTIAASIAIDQDLEFIGKVWSGLTDDQRDRIVRAIGEFIK